MAQAQHGHVCKRLETTEIHIEIHVASRQILRLAFIDRHDCVVSTRRIVGTVGWPDLHRDFGHENFSLSVL